MPTRLCLEPRCPNTATYRGRCPTHSRQRERATHPNKRLYNSRRWQYTRRKQLHMEPLCACGEIATDVDHIRPVEAGGDPWHFANLASMCHECHSRKTRREQGATNA
jgi:5-methylcytosine-specific restriction protein A